jgi:hypothetical protein
MARGHIAEVNPDTCAIKVLPYCFVDDFGTVISPLLVDGPAHGGIRRGCDASLFIAGTEDARLPFRAINGRTGRKADSSMRPPRWRRRRHSIARAIAEFGDGLRVQAATVWD